MFAPSLVAMMAVFSSAIGGALASGHGSAHGQTGRPGVSMTAPSSNSGESSSNGVPEFLYRADDRSPSTMAYCGRGIRCRAPSYLGFNQKIDKSMPLEFHINPAAVDSRKDPWISAWQSQQDVEKWIARRFQGRRQPMYIYIISTAGIETSFVNVKAELERTKADNSQGRESEYATKTPIPWSRVIAWEEISPNGKITRRNNPDFVFKARHLKVNTLQAGGYFNAGGSGSDSDSSTGKFSEAI